MELPKIKNQTLREQVYEILREKITTAEIKPGERVTLRGLTQRLDVSIAPVREALFALESEKVVEIFSNKHIQIKKLAHEEIVEIYEIRANLESILMQRACDRAMDQDITRIGKHLAKLRLSTGNGNDYITHNRNFHFSIYELADSPVTLELVTNLWARVGSYIYLHYSRRKDISMNMAHHETMFTALSNRDKQALTGALKKDLEIAATDILKTLDEELDNAPDEKIAQ